MLTYENDFARFVTEIDSGNEIEIDQEMFDYFLEVLPPVRMATNVQMPDGSILKACFLAAEGCEQLTAFYWKPGMTGRRFAKLIPYMSDGNGGVFKMKPKRNSEADRIAHDLSYEGSNDYARDMED